MKKVHVLFSILLFIMLSAFNVRPGGDSFSIYMNDKLMVEQFVLRKEGVKTISVSQVKSGDVLKVLYNHCGKVGEGRSLIFKDRNDRVIKSWTFENVNELSKGSMTIKLSDIAALSSNSSGKLSIIYASKEISNGTTLAYLDFDQAVKASLK